MYVCVCGTHQCSAFSHCAHRSLAISVSEEQLALALHGGPAFTLALNNQELMKAEDMNFELLGTGVHTAGAYYVANACILAPARCAKTRMY